MSDSLRLDVDAEEPLFMRLAAYMRTQEAAPGTAMPTESALAVRFGVGRPQIREALATLEGLGAVYSRRGAARVWLGIDAGAIGGRLGLLLNDPQRTVGELLQIRHALETTLLPQAAANLSRADLAKLRDLAVAMVVVCGRGESFASIDEEFHLTLFSRLGNDLLDGVLAAFWAMFRATRPPAGSVVEDPVIAAMHGHIIDAIEAGDLRLATHEMDAHFYGVRNRIPPRSTISDD